MSSIIAPNTMNQIRTLLGDARRRETGYEKAGAIQGQIIITLDNGSSNYIPKTIEYKGIVVENNSRKDWEISTQIIP